MKLLGISVDITFVPNKKYGQLITASPETLIMLKSVNTEF